MKPNNVGACVLLGVPKEGRSIAVAVKTCPELVRQLGLTVDGQNPA